MVPPTTATPSACAAGAPTSANAATSAPALTTLSAFIPSSSSRRLTNNETAPWAGPYVVADLSQRLQSTQTQRKCRGYHQQCLDHRLGGGNRKCEPERRVDGRPQ